MFIETAKCVFSSTIKVYELLGAEVFLYFDLGEFPMTARVDPRSNAKDLATLLDLHSMLRRSTYSTKRPSRLSPTNQEHSKEPLRNAMALFEFYSSLVPF